MKFSTSILVQVSVWAWNSPLSVLVWVSKVYESCSEQPYLRARPKEEEKEYTVSSFIVFPFWLFTLSKGKDAVKAKAGGLLRRLLALGFFFAGFWVTFLDGNYKCESARRSPMSLPRPSCTSKPRQEDRQILLLPYQPPPRFTRTAPLEGPVGFVCEDEL